MSSEQPAHADDRVHRRPDLVAHRREERALRLVGRLRRARGVAQVAEEAGVVDRDRGLLRKPDEEVEVCGREGPLPGPVRQTTMTPLTPPRPSSGAAIRRSCSSCSGVPGDVDGTLVGVGVVDDLRLGRGGDRCR